MIESTDAVVIGNSCRALAVFANASLHSSDFAFHLLQEFWLVQTSRLEDLLKGALPNEETGQDENSESSIHLCILRLSLLAKVWSVLNGNSADLLVEQLSTAVTSYLATELQSRRLVYHRDDETSSSSVHIPEIWSSRDENVHSVVSRSVSDGLDLLLALIAWRLKQEIQRIDKGENEPGGAENHLILRLRQRIEQIIGLCYEQYIPREEMDDYSDAHQMFSIHVQEHGIRVSGDIRMLFPRKWLQAKSPFLKAVAIENDSVLAGGSFRFVRSREWLMKDNRDDNAQAKASNEQELMFQLLLPLARALGINWENGSRKEAGAALVHLIGSGKETSEMVLCMSRVLKKMCPVRFLEAQMAFLRERFEIWADGEPEEPGDRPTEQEMQEFEEQERLHQQKFDVLVQFAAKFSATLGVGKIRDAIMNRALSGFVREGIRFAFSTDVKGSDEPLSAGVRLPFLTILQKYLTWIRSNKDARNNLMNELNQQEMELRSDPQYGEVFEEDLNALLDFRKVGELGDYPLNGDGDTFVTSKISGSKITSTKGLKPRTSMGSSVSSIHSKASASLNSIQEDVAMDTDEENESHESPSPQKRPRLSSARSQASVATSKGPSFEDDTDDGSSPQKRPRSSSARSRASVATSRGPSFDDDSDDGSDTGGSSSI
jgi:cohesin complex subunit SA-1/2